ncbi:tetratricopeptide repeat protein [Haliscomenobacter hydrossis]|uniref:Tetratricopeptide TPR_1 repeat-containing protein n=1 Tax=Haliscomenobacter hydrossis (strain ATCC 27775 / DSM 1100 / LMG 10767 / O) TaxID=760192 RepID=F4L2A5_HALH1|nr:tetratricopeptide repeat protein [Haliscomenobacter hydrossis]AEE52858.1 Tetratricopeptide TPR_1 repeat-containing protein [Haliscomenobacter hydrossis DSM 1100]
MKLKIVLFFLLNSLIGLAQVKTTGEQSPAVIAKNFSAVYGVRTDAILEILNVFEESGLSAIERKNRTEEILKTYQKTPERKQGGSYLSETSKKELGIFTHNSKIIDALNWDLFAQKKYLSVSTSGINSPAVNAAGGEVNIWYGVPPKVLQVLAETLEKNKIALIDFEDRLKELVKKYEALKTEFDSYGKTDPIIKEAERLLNEGNIFDAEKLIDSDYGTSKRRQAYKGYLLGKTKELLLKYDSASIGLRDAVFLEPDNSKYLIALARLESVLAHYDDALLYYEKALEIEERINANRPEWYSFLYSDIGNVRRLKGDYNLGIEYLKKAIAIDSVILGREDANFAVYFNNIGLCYDSKGEYESAVKYYNRAIKINLTFSGNDYSKLAHNYNNLGTSYLSKGEIDTSISCLEKALTYALSAYEGKHLVVANTYNSLGSAWQKNGNYERAKEFLGKSIQIISQIFGDRHPDLAVQYNNIGTVLEEQGQYDKAIFFYERALEIDSQFLGMKHHHVAIRYNNLGMAWAQKADYQKAMAFVKKALNIDSVALGYEHHQLAKYYDNLGSIFVDLGIYDSAIIMHKKALLIDLSAFGENHSNVGTRYNNLGLAFQHLGQLDKALDFYEKALSILENKHADQHPDLAACFTNIGSVWQERGDFNRALGLFEKSLQIAVKFFGDKHPRTAIALEKLGLIYKDKGDYDKALSYYNQAFLIDSVALGMEHPVIADLYYKIGSVWQYKKFSTFSIKFLEKALTINLKVFGKSHVEVAKCYHTLGLVRFDLTEYDLAILAFEQCKAILSSNDPHFLSTIQMLAQAANARGMQFSSIGQYASALPYLQKSLEDIEKLKDWPLSVIFYYNLGFIYKSLRDFENGIFYLDKGLTSASEIFQQTTGEIVNNPEWIAQIDQNKRVSRLMKFHKISCLVEVRRKKEAKTLSTKLYLEAMEAKDDDILQGLKREGWIKKSRI